MYNYQNRETMKEKKETEKKATNPEQPSVPVRERMWREKFAKIEAYINEHHHLPSKKKKDHMDLVNWWKYNVRLAKRGKLSEARLQKLRALSESRDGYVLVLPEKGK